MAQKNIFLFFNKISFFKQDYILEQADCNLSLCIKTFITIYAVLHRGVKANLCMFMCMNVCSNPKKSNSQV